MATDSKHFSHTASLSDQVLPPRKRIPDWITALLKNPVSIIGTILVILFALVAIFAPLIAPPPIPSEPYQIPRDGFSAEPQPPSAANPLGTTQGQYDIFYGVGRFCIGLSRRLGR